MNVADHILARLADEGITTAFLVYGGAMSELAEAFTRQDRIHYVCCQHEQAAVFAAEGYAKASGKPGLVIVTSGPGVGNIVTGIQNCYYDSVPLIALTGQVATNLIRPAESSLRQLGFQETPTVAMLEPITKYAVQVTDPKLALFQLDVAIGYAKMDRPGPVVVDMPTDVQRARIDHRRLGKPWTARNPNGCQDAASAFLSDLQASQRPGILVGGGAYGARQQIEAFAAAHNIPVFRTWNALDVVPDNSPVYAGTVGTYGGPGRNFGIQNTDLLLVLGCRISGRITGGSPVTFARGAKKYIVDVDPGLLEHGNQQVKGDVNVWADAGKFAACLTSADKEWSDWLGRCRDWIATYDPVKSEMLTQWHHYGFMRQLSAQVPENAIIVSDTGGNQIMMGHCWRSKAGQRIFASNGNTPMGFALCGAIGAWFAEPERPIICIIGDGGMQLNIQELQTIWQYSIPIKIFVIDNGVLGNTKAWQRVNRRAEIACGPDGYSAPSFQAIAQAYGIPAMYLNSWERFDYVVGHALQSDGPFLVDVYDPDRCTYEPRISRWDVPIEDMEPFLPREEFRKQMIIEPMKGWEKNV